MRPAMNEVGDLIRIARRAIDWRSGKLHICADVPPSPTGLRKTVCKVYAPYQKWVYINDISVLSELGYVCKKCWKIAISEGWFSD